MKILVLFFSLVAGAMVQAVLPTPDWLGHAHAPVLLSLVLFYALAHNETETIWAAVLAGLLQDALGQIPLGFSPFCFCLVGMAVGRFRDAVFEHAVLTHMLFGALASGAVTLVLSLLLWQQDLIHMGPLAMCYKALGGLAIGGVVVPVAFGLLAALDRMLGTVEPEKA